MTEEVALSYVDRIAAALADGYTFGALYASDSTTVRAVLLDPNEQPRVESVACVDGVAPSIVRHAPAAGWDEREANDQHGISFAGHDPLRPLLNHLAPTDAWTVPVHGQGPYDIAVGPIHAGIIESGHFRLHVVGERILHLDARLFYKHRGLEAAAQHVPLDDALAHVGRACAACSVSNAVAYALACETSLDVQVDSEVTRVRTILLELERVWSHLNDIAAVCAGVGLAAGTAYFSALTERARRLNGRLTGHRFLAGTVRIGCSDLAWSADDVALARTELRELDTAARRGWRELAFNASFQDRLPGVGVLTAADCQTLGTVGPAARAAGLPIDSRAHAPRLAYEDFTPMVADGAAGDVQARLEQRSLELTQSVDILTGLLGLRVQPVGRMSSDAAGAGIGVGVVESPRGRTVCVVEYDAGRVERLHLRTGSYANWPSVAHAAAGNVLPDFPLINKSFELCYACVDR